MSGVPGNSSVRLALVRRVDRDSQVSSTGGLERSRCATVTAAPADRKNTYASTFELNTTEVTPLRKTPAVVSATTARNRRWVSVVAARNARQEITRMLASIPTNA